MEVFSVGGLQQLRIYSLWGEVLSLDQEEKFSQEYQYDERKQLSTSQCSIWEP